MYRVFKPTYTKNGERRESRNFNIAFRDHLNRRQTIVALPDERRSIAFADKLQRLIEARQTSAALPLEMRNWIDRLDESTRERLVRVDLIDPTSAASDRPLLEHLNGRQDEKGELLVPGYRQALIARGNTQKHVDVTTQRVRTILTECGFALWRDVMKPGAANVVHVHLGGLREKKKIGGQSFNYYIRDFRGFLNWMIEEKRAAGSLLPNLKPVKNAEVDSIRRRALLVDEMRWLVAVTQKSKARQNVPGPDRAILYRFAFETGSKKVRGGGRSVRPPPARSAGAKRGRAYC